MRFSPTKLLQGLLCTTPILVLALAACGGGSSTATFGSAYTLSVSVSGVSGIGLMLRNGQDTLSPTAPGNYPFPTKVLSGSTYNITVPTNPSGPTQLCTVATPTAVMPAYNNPVAVNCVAAYTISGTVTSTVPLGAGLVLQNNGGDDLLVPAGGTSTSFVFSTPLLASSDPAAYTVTITASPKIPPQTCGFSGSDHGPVSSSVPNTVTINCVASSNATTDPYVYTADFGANQVSAYTANASGVILNHTMQNAGSQPYAIAVDPAGTHAYAVNYGANTVSVYNIASGVLSTNSTQTTGNGPRAIAIDPAGTFAYVANFLSNSVSAYLIDGTGALSRTDTDDVTTGVQYSIPAKVGPNSIAIDPLGKYLYVANSGASGSNGSISVYSINTDSASATFGALTAIDADGIGPGTGTSVPAGTNTTSVAIDPDGKNLYAANWGSGTNNAISVFNINSDGSLAYKASEQVVYNPSPSFITLYPGGHVAYVGDSSGFICVYNINTDGTLDATICSQLTTGSAPLSMSIDSTGQNAYIANSGSSDGTGGLSVYSINIATGALSPVGSYNTGSNPYAVTTSH